MKINRAEYVKYAEGRAKRSPIIRDCAAAYVVGGGICAFGEWLSQLYAGFGISEETVKMLVPCSLIILAAIATGLGFFDKIAKFAGAGTLVPITGFSNSVVSPAIDNRAEGYVTGVGAKIFIVAGPVILYGTVAAVAYGVIYYLVTQVFGG